MVPDAQRHDVHAWQRHDHRVHVDGLILRQSVRQLQCDTLCSAPPASCYNRLAKVFDWVTLETGNAHRASSRIRVQDAEVVCFSICRLE
jgi:hypothetical protein